jgi:hypothetical protein
MPLTTNDVRAILQDAIIQGKMAPDDDVAAALATTLSAAITPNLNLIVGTQTGLIPISSVAAPVMSIVEALTVRDAVSHVIADEFSGNLELEITAASEALLKTGYVDVPKVLALAREDDQTTATPAPSTGSHAVSVAPDSLSSLAS